LEANQLPAAYAATPTQVDDARSRSKLARWAASIVMCDVPGQRQAGGGVDASAVQEYSRLLNGLQLLRYLDSWTILGTAAQM
jgi:hypothetical protein